MSLTVRRPNFQAVPASHARGILIVIERRLKSSHQHERYVTSAELAQAIELNPGVPLSPTISQYLSRMLRGEIPKPKGRPLADDLTRIRDALALAYYREFKAWLQRRAKPSGLQFKILKDAHWWSGPPHERAARMAVRKLQRFRTLPACDYRHVVNLASAKK